jgi:hypothetical protein
MEGHNMNDEIKNIELADRDTDVAMGENFLDFSKEDFLPEKELLLMILSIRNESVKSTRLFL